LLPSKVCPICGRPFFSLEADRILCLSCAKKRPPFLIHRSAGLYAGKLRELILLFKYCGFEVLKKPLAEFLHLRLKKEASLWNVDFLVPVPSHRKRVRTRGFDHTLELAKELSRISGLPVLKALSRVKFTLPQAGLGRKAREENLRKAFELTEKVKDLKLLLVDDIFTTGITMREASKTLKAGGAIVHCITIARNL